MKNLLVALIVVISSCIGATGQELISFSGTFTCDDPTSGGGETKNCICAEGTGPCDMSECTENCDCNFNEECNMPVCTTNCTCNADFGGLATGGFCNMPNCSTDCECSDILGPRGCTMSKLCEEDGSGCYCGFLPPLVPDYSCKAPDGTVLVLGEACTSYCGDNSIGKSSKCTSHCTCSKENPCPLAETDSVCNGGGCDMPLCRKGCSCNQYGGGGPCTFSSGVTIAPATLVVLSSVSVLLATLLAY